MGTQGDDIQFKVGGGGPGRVPQLSDVSGEIVELCWKRENTVHIGTCKYIAENGRKVTRASSRRGCVLTNHVKELGTLNGRPCKSPMLESPFKLKEE